MKPVRAIKRITRNIGKNRENFTVWQEFVQELTKVDFTMYGLLTPHDELTIAEGYRHFARMLVEGVRTMVEYPDPIQPVISEKPFYAGDTSDARYFDAIIDGSQTYCIEGYRGTAPLIEFSVYDGKPGVSENSKPISCILEDELKVNSDGTYKLILSPNEHEGNWVKTSSEIKYLFIRQYSHDWSKHHKASFNIRLANAGQLPTASSLTIDSIRQRLRGVISFMEIITKQWTTQVNVIRLLPSNKLVKAPEGLGQAIPSGHHFASGNFKLKGDEALIIDFKPPENVPYWGFQLVNFWFEPIDYGLSGSHTNNKAVTYDKDGWVRLVVAHQDPGVQNWIQTQMHMVGVMIFRLSRRSAKEIPSFKSKVVRLDQVKDHKKLWLEKH